MKVSHAVNKPDKRWQPPNLQLCIMCLEYDHIDQEFLPRRETEKKILYVYFPHIMNDGPFVSLFDFGNNFRKGQEYAH